MRIVRFVSILAGSVLALAAPALPAQIVSSLAGSGRGSVAGAARQPYTMTATQTSVQTLANGTTITSESTSRVAHDSAGRTYSEQHHTLPAGPEGQSDGQPRETVSYFVNDPVARTSLTWNSNTREATLTHHLEPQWQRAAPEVRSDVAPAARPEHTVRRPQQEIQRENLGTKTIAGVNAVGERTTRVIPAGSEGNDQPLTITDETWRSLEYGVILSSIHDDPRNGKSTREVTDFQPGEPDTALFKAPEGYTVREITPQRAAVAAQ